MNESLSPGELSVERQRVNALTGPREYDTEIQLLGRIAAAVDRKMPVDVLVISAGQEITEGAGVESDRLYSVAAVEGNATVSFIDERSDWVILEGVVIEFIDGADILTITAANPGKVQVCTY